MTAVPQRTHPVARLVSDWLEPRTWITGVTLAVGVAADGFAGAGWALLAIFSATVLPTLLIRYGVRHGKYSDRHLAVRQQRLPVMIFAISVVAACVGLLSLAGAPRAVIAMTITMLTTVTLLTAVTAVWKISLHTATSAGSVTILITTFGPALAAGYLVTVLIVWSRIVLRDHTPLQAVAGVAVGLASAMIYLALH